MQKKRIGIVGIVMSLLLLVCFVGCAQTQTQAATNGKITLNFKSAAMRVGDSVVLRVLTDTGEKSAQSVTWSSSDKKIVTVNKNGVVKAKKKGTATITATTADKKTKASCKITVKKKTTTDSRVLVVYFSCTNNTEGIAQKIANVTGGDLCPITPAKAYTEADLDYGDKNSRTTKEQNNKDVRPQMKGKVASLQKYDTIFLGYPIWWGKAPRIMDNFVESYDLSGKTVIPFCTSGSSGIGSSASELEKLCSGSAKWLEGKRFSGSASETVVREWVESLGFEKKGENTAMKMRVQVGDKTYTATLADNSSAKALAEKLAEGPITVEMHDYGNFEKVGPLGFSLPRNDEQITTQAGDIILYQGNQITIYYDKNSWKFTRLGKIDNVTADELKAALGAGDVTVVLSLNES